MTTLPPEFVEKHFENDASKEAFLDTFRPTALSAEINAMEKQGYDIQLGDTLDTAYEHIDKINEVFDRLKQTGEEFSRQRIIGTMSLQALQDGTRLLPRGNLKRFAKKRISESVARDERLRSALLYDLPDVQGAAWHIQNGRALSLGTIVDADALGSVYPTISGRISTDLLTHEFGHNTGWLAGHSVSDALRHTLVAPEFRAHPHPDPDEKVSTELFDVHSFLSAPVHEGFKDIVLYSSDSLGIRSRKEEVRQEIQRYTDEAGKESYLMMSVGCGTAQPMLEVVQDLRVKGKSATLILLDQDPIALAAAEHVARLMGLDDSIEIHCNQLFEGSGLKTKVMDIQKVLMGRKLDICEDSGLREYFTDTLYKDLATQSWNAVIEGGLVTTGNMNKNRPQPEFLHGLMGWPIPVRMREINDLARLHQSAGIPVSATRYRVTQDGVYTLCFSQKS